MRTINVTVPNFTRDFVEKQVKKASKHIPEVSVKFSPAYKKAYEHLVVDKGHDMFTRQTIVMIHEVTDMTLTLPDANGWFLKCKYEQGVPHITDFSKPLEIKAVGHGSEYDRCDYCGHKAWAQSYLIENADTGEELQVGAECMKSFGITNLIWVEKLMDVLYKTFFEEDDCGCNGFEDERFWGFKKDPNETRSVVVTDCIKAAKQYYDDCKGVWIKGYYEGRFYIPSKSKEELDGYIASRKFSESATDEYVAALQSYLSEKVFPNATPPNAWDSGFDWQMCDTLSKYYMSVADCAFAFFAVKKYEQHLAAQKLAKIEKGEYIHAVGVVTSHRWEEGYYGLYDIFEVKTDSGRIIRRNGKIKTTKDEDGVEHAEFFAMVEYVFNNGTLSVGRTTTKPKKGVEYIAI